MRRLRGGEGPRSGGLQDRLGDWAPVYADRCGHLVVYCTSAAAPSCGARGLLYAKEGAGDSEWVLREAGGPLPALLVRLGALEELHASLARLRAELLPAIALGLLDVKIMLTPDDSDCYFTEDWPPRDELVRTLAEGGG